METSLSPSSPQFSRLEYSLQLAVKASTARIKSASLVSNPSWTIQFEKRCQNIMTLDAWIEPADLLGSGQGGSGELLTRLNSFLPLSTTTTSSSSSAPSTERSNDTSKNNRPKSFIKAKVGKLSFAEASHQKISKTLVYARLGVGRAYYVDSAASSKLSVDYPLPDGYDCYYLKHQNDDDAESHTYLIGAYNQVLPLYVATFEFDPMEEKRSRERPVCDNCEASMASVFCSADSAYLCKDCDVNLHLSKIAQKHPRTQLGKGPDAFGHCRVHVDTGIEYFCSHCHIPVCIHCKMVGHHSSGEASKHPLVKVADAFEVVLKESSKKDTELEQRALVISKQMNAIQARGKDIDQMHSRLQQELKEIYEKALLQLKKEVEKKKIVLIGDECELKRQKDELKQLEEFLDYQRTAVDMYHLLFNWSTHQAMRQNVREFQFLRQEIDVSMDLRVSGALDIVKDKKDGSMGNNMSLNQYHNEQRKSTSLRPVSSSNVLLSSDNNISGNKLSLRKTTDIFSDVLKSASPQKVNSGGHEMMFERLSVRNALDVDEKSVTKPNTIGTATATTATTTKGYVQVDNDNDYCCY